MMMMQQLCVRSSHYITRSSSITVVRQMGCYEAKVRLDTEQALAESDETGDMKKRVGRKMMQLDTIEEKQSTKKIVDWEGKAPKDKGNEHNPKPSRRTGNYLVAGKLDD